MAEKETITISSTVNVPDVGDIEVSHVVDKEITQRHGVESSGSVDHNTHTKIYEEDQDSRDPRQQSQYDNRQRK